jgi:hypothetical protein
MADLRQILQFTAEFGTVRLWRSYYGQVRGFGSAAVVVIATTAGSVIELNHMLAR